MKKFPVVLDLETKLTFREVDDPKKLGITVIAVYDYKTGQPKVYEEKEISSLFPVLENASYIVGFNIRTFDIQVLQGYYPGDVSHFPIFDTMDEVKNSLGRRLSLNELISATLGKKKTG